MLGALTLAVALMFVIEGLLPFVSPAMSRGVFRKLGELSDGQLRFLGLASMLSGLVMLYFYQ